MVAVADAAVVEHSIFPVDEAGLGGAAAVLWGLGCVAMEDGGFTPW